jgi:hypothetical protein
MKRIISLVVVALVMAAMMLAMAMPAFAFNSENQPPGPPTFSGGNGALVVHCNSDQIGREGAVANNKNGAHGGGNC